MESPTNSNQKTQTGRTTANKQRDPTKDGDKPRPNTHE